MKTVSLINAKTELCIAYRPNHGFTVTLFLHLTTWFLCPNITTDKVMWTV